MNLDDLKAYKLVRKENLSDIRSTGYLLRHIKTGARIMVIENDDDNKVSKYLQKRRNLPSGRMELPSGEARRSIDL